MNQPNQGAPPPAQQGMSAGKIILIIVGTIGILLFGTCVVCSLVVGGAATAVEEGRKDREAKKVEQKAELVKNMEKCSKGESMEWSSVAANLKDNEAKIAAAWKGSCAKVNGVVKSINSGIGDKPYVVIGGGEALSLNNMHCKPEDPSKALTLSKGQSITVWGVGGNEIMGSLVLDHCDW